MIYRYLSASQHCVRCVCDVMRLQMPADQFDRLKWKKWNENRKSFEDTTVQFDT